MAFMSSYPGSYINQWLQPATGKNVICQKAMPQDRLMSTCARYDKALAAKIAELQSSDKEKAKENYYKLPAFKPLPMKGGGMIHPFNALNDNSMDSIEPLEMDGNGGPWNPKTDVDAELAKTKAVENIPKIKVLQQAIKDQQAKLLGQHQGTTTQTVTPAKKDKVLEQPVGRKFR